MNVTKIIADSDKFFQLEVTMDFFLEDPFWRLFKILIFSTWIPLSLIYGYGAYSVIKKNEKKSNTKMPLAIWTLVKLKWIFEMYDYTKDWDYLVNMRHGLGFLLLLIFTLTSPFCTVGEQLRKYYNYETTVIHQFLILIGVDLKHDENLYDKQETTRRAKTVVSILENGI